MRTMRDKLPFDPYTEVVMALHDALAYSNRWIDYNTSQYQGVCELLTSLVNQQTINNSSVETAILTLENLGFNTLPFGLTIDENLDIDTGVSALMRYILSPLLACGEGVGGGVLVPHNIGKCCKDEE